MITGLLIYYYLVTKVTATLNTADNLGGTVRFETEKIPLGLSDIIHLRCH